VLTSFCSLPCSYAVTFRFLVVEDTHIGLKAAKAAGMHCLVTKSIYTQREDFAVADRVVDSLENPKIRLNDLSKITADNI
jgi:beta-phosphoglucomutase-like phosphatase (HAD superfamily)